MIRKPVNSVINSLGAYFPKNILANDDFVHILAASGKETSDAWIKERTGIEERRVCSPGESVESMSANAARDCVNRASDIPPIEYVIVATNTPARKFPGIAPHVLGELSNYQDATGRNIVCDNASGCDIEAGCAGINHALMAGDSLIRSGLYHSVLVIGCDMLSSITDYADRETCILFGDGAGAYHLVAHDDLGFGFLGHDMSSDSAKREKIYCNALEEKVILAEALCVLREGVKPIKSLGPVIHMDGRAVYKYVVSLVKKLIASFPENHYLNPDGIPFERVRFVTPHQANMRMIESIDGDVPGFSGRCRLNLRYFGNTSTASQILSLMDILYTEAERGDYVFEVAYGAGLTGGAGLYRVPHRLVGRIPITDFVAEGRRIIGPR